VVRRWPGGGSVGAVSTSGAESGRQVGTVEAAWHGDGDGGSTRWRPTEEAVSVDGGGPDGARRPQGGKGTIRLPRSEERGAQRGRSP
jgi:hypothetical protein